MPNCLLKSLETGPGPPEKKGKHRYVLALFAGEAKEGPKDRKQWGTDTVRGQAYQWSKGQGLTLLGRSLIDVW